jgi:uncharacterized BrkB/YihY/UPF0761 family membrane protein
LQRCWGVAAEYAQATRRTVVRHVIVAVFLVLCLVGVAGTPAVIGDMAVATVHAQEIEIQIGSDPWYQQPVWIAIMVIAAIVVIMLVVMATRGGSKV